MDGPTILGIIATLMLLGAIIWSEIGIRRFDRNEKRRRGQ